MKDLSWNTCKFRLVITFHCRVTKIFVKIVFCYPSQVRTFENGLFEKWTQKCDKILLSVKEICIGDYEVETRSVHWWGIAWRFDNLPLAWAFLQRQRNHSIASPCWTTIEHLHRGNCKQMRSCSSRKLSHHCSRTCSSSRYFKIICPYNSAREVENAVSRSLLGSSFPDSRTDGPLYWDLSQTTKKNWWWARCDRTCDNRWWELDSPLWSSHKTGEQALEISAVCKEESPSGEIDE